MYQFESIIVLEAGKADIGLMDKVVRTEMIRLSFRANGGIPFASTGIRKPKAYRPPNRPKGGDEWPQIEVNHKRMPQWLFEIERAHLALAPKRIAHPSPLTRIAEQLPAKLPRILF